MKKYILPVLIGIGLVAGTGPALAAENRVPSLDIGGEITVGAVLGEDVLRQAFPQAEHFREAFSSVEGSVVMRINGVLVRVTKNGGTVVEILDGPVTYAGEVGEYDEEKEHEGWEEAEERKREQWKRQQERQREQWKRQQERQREQAKMAAEREREARKRAAERAREARKDREELRREMRNSREETGAEAKEDRQIRL